MNSFPDELLLQVFKYVPSKDRRNSVRLVCRRWNQIAEDQTFTQEERIIVNYYYVFEELLSNLQASWRSLFNLSFVKQVFSEKNCNHRFWKFRGSQVRSLVFENCVLTFTNLIKILSLCPNVKHISLIGESGARPISRSKISSGIDLTDMRYFAVIDNITFTANSVTSFSWQMYYLDINPLTYKIMSKILSTFPNLEELKLKIPSDYSYKNKYPFQFRPSKESPLVAIAHYLQTRSRKLKKLWLMQQDLEAYVLAEIKLLKMLSELENLEELTVTGKQFLDFYFQSPAALLMKLPKITILNLSSISKNSGMDCILNQILDTAPNLRVVRLEFTSIFYYNEHLLKKLLSSKLKKLQLFCKRSVPVSETNHDFGPLPANRTLEELVVCGRMEFKENNLFTLISPYLANLRYLAISYPTDEDLQSIFKNQKYLKSLMLEYCDSCSDFGYTGRYPSLTLKKNYSIEELKELEYLRISDMNLELTTETTTYFFMLPKLKRLEIYILKNDHGIENNPLSVIGLIDVIEKSRHLEALELRVPTTISLERLKTLLPALKNIRHFSISFNSYEEGRPLRHEVSQLFDMCPTLRFMVYDNKNILPMKWQEISRFKRGIRCTKLMEIIPKWSNSNENNPLLTPGFENFRFDY